MAAKDTTDALQNPHPEGPFARVGDDTISALAELATILKLKLRQTPPLSFPDAPPTVKQHTCLAESSTPNLASPIPLPCQTRSQTTVTLLPLPQPPLLARMDARTNPSAQRATQLRSVLARVCAVSRQNQITTTFP
jgi:hypothetical protein